jgi:hypothetical protein
MMKQENFGGRIKLPLQPGVPFSIRNAAPYAAAPVEGFFIEPRVTHCA